MEIEFPSQVFREGRLYVAYAPELDVSSCGGTPEKAKKNLLEAVRLFLEEAERMETLKQILREAGYVRRKRKLEAPKLKRTAPSPREGIDRAEGPDASGAAGWPNSTSRLSGKPFPRIAIASPPMPNSEWASAKSPIGMSSRSLWLETSSKSTPTLFLLRKPFS